jgi:hypothetical protein
MTYDDLTVFDLNLIKSMASNLLATTKMNCRYEALSEVVLSCIYSKGFQVEPYPKSLSLVIAKEVSYSPLNHRDYTADEVIKAIFGYLQKHKLEIKKDESRNPTWSTPKPGWYIQHVNKRYPWQW